jgi:hypothetical protein
VTPEFTVQQTVQVLQDLGFGSPGFMFTRRPP